MEGEAKKTSYSYNDAWLRHPHRCGTIWEILSWLATELFNLGLFAFVPSHALLDDERDAWKRTPFG